MNDEQEPYQCYGDSCSGVYPPKDFEGLWVEHWPNGNLKFRGHYEKSLRRIGQHLSFFENGVLQELSFWDEGWVCGTLIWFNEDGSKECEKDFGEHGGRTRSWTERYFRRGSHRIRSIRVWRNDELFVEWIDPELRQLLDDIGADNFVEEAIRQVHPDE